MYYVDPVTFDVEDLGVARAANIYNVGAHQITEFWHVDNPAISRASHIQPDATSATLRRKAARAPDAGLEAPAAAARREPAPAAKKQAVPEAAPAPAAKKPAAPEAAPAPAAKKQAAPEAAPAPAMQPSKILTEESEEVLL
jgi:hypothetical protein